MRQVRCSPWNGGDCMWQVWSNGETIACGRCDAPHEMAVIAYDRCEAMVKSRRLHVMLSMKWWWLHVSGVKRWWNLSQTSQVQSAREAGALHMLAAFDKFHILLDHYWPDSDSSNNSNFWTFWRVSITGIKDCGEMKRQPFEFQHQTKLEMRAFFARGAYCVVRLFLFISLLTRKKKKFTPCNWRLLSLC